MGSTNLNEDFSHLESSLSSFPMIKRYIVLCLCFKLKDQSSIDDVQFYLRAALERLTKAFPYMAGQVVIEGQAEGRTGTSKIKPLGESIELLVNDLRNDPEFPTMAEMSSASYPFSMLDPDILCPSIALEWTGDDDNRLTAPVLILKANFVRGGLILMVSGNHQTMDMTGMGLIISLFSKACRNEPFSDEEIQLGNQSRRDAIPLLGDEYKTGTGIDDVIARPQDALVKEAIESKPRWAYFNFQAENLARLKKEASQQDIVPYISTDDAIGALCWQRIAEARKSRLGKGSETTFCRPISLRNYLGLKMFIGHMVDCVFETAVDVWNQPIGEIAGRLRRMIQQDEQIVYHMRAFATTLTRLDDKTKLVNGAKLNPNRDVVMSSYANIKCCGLSFGPLLGQPEAARRPRMPVWPALCYLMPKATNGDIAVAFCIGEDDMSRLRQDKVLASYAEYVG